MSVGFVDIREIVDGDLRWEVSVRIVDIGVFVDDHHGSNSACIRLLLTNYASETMDVTAVTRIIGWIQF